MHSGGQLTVGQLTVGQVARRIGAPVRTVRFWSDQGLVEPVARSAAGYRTYDATAVARLDLVRTLRELGLGLSAIRELLERRRTVAEIAAEHVRALDVELRILRLRRALLHHMATASTTTEELRIMHKLASLSARERQEMIDAFVERAFADIPPNAPGANLAGQLRTLPAELPDEPTTEQIDAWLELAGVLQDPAFADRVREMALVGASVTTEEPDALLVDMGRLQSIGRQALSEQVPPGSPRAEELVRELLHDGRAAAPDRRSRLADRLATFTDERVERFWALLGVLNGWPAWEPSVPAVRWWITTLRT